MVKRKLAAPKKERVKKKRASQQGTTKATEANAELHAQIPSDEESISEKEGGEGTAKGEEDAFFETPDEKRVRLAKEYLSQLGEARGPEEVQEQLVRDVAQQQRRARVQVEGLALGEPRFCRGHKEVPTCLCLSADERTIVSGGKDCALLQWDVETGKKNVFHPGGKKQFDCGGHFGFVMDVCMLEQQGLMLSTGYDRLVRFWDLRAPPGSACIAKLQGHRACATAVVADLDGSTAYSTSLDKSLKVWDVPARRCRDTLFGHVSGVTCMDLYTNGRPVTGGIDATARLWKLERDTHLVFSKHTYPVDSVCALDHESFASGSQDGGVLLWSQTSKKPIASALQGKGRWATALGAVKPGNVFFCGSDDGSLRSWRLARRPNNGKSGLELVEAAPAVQLPGCVNALAVGRRVLACAVGKEHKLGRWFYSRSQRNGIVLVPLSYCEG